MFNKLKSLALPIFFFLIAPLGVFASTYPATDSLPNYTDVVSRHLLDESSGVRYDETANDNDLTDNNTVGYEAGLSMTGAVFDNSAAFVRDQSEYLSISDGSQTELDFTSDFTTSSFIRIGDLPDLGEEYVIATKSGTADNQSWILYLDNEFFDYSIVLGVSDDGLGFTEGYVDWVSPSAATWYHVVSAYDASEGSVSIYLDGSILGSDTGLDNSIYDGTSPFKIGGEPFYDGRIQDLIIWDVLLSSGSVLDLYELYTTSTGESGSGSTTSTGGLSIFSSTCDSYTDGGECSSWSHYADEEAVTAIRVEFASILKYILYLGIYLLMGLGILFISAMWLWRIITRWRPPRLRLFKR